MTDMSSYSDLETRSDSDQRLVSYGATIGSIALAAQHIFIEGHFHGWPTIGITLVSLLGWGILAVGVLNIRRMGKTPEGRAFLEHSRSDERLVALRARSFTFGFGAMIIFQAILLLLWTLFGHTDPGMLSIPVAASSTIAAGVTGAVLRFHILLNR